MAERFWDEFLNASSVCYGIDLPPIAWGERMIHCPGIENDGILEIIRNLSGGVYHE